MTAFLRQSDPEWSAKPYGATDGRHTIGRHGCLLTAVCQAAHQLGTDLEVTPAILQDAAREADAFIGPDLIVHQTARLVGLEAPWSQYLRMADGRSRDDLCEGLEAALAKGLAILHVDHDRTRPGGDPEPDHFILALRFSEESTEGRRWVVCIDPATGLLVPLSWPRLDGEATWGTPRRRYDVRSVRPIWRV